LVFTLFVLILNWRCVVTIYYLLAKAVFKHKAGVFRTVELFGSRNAVETQENFCVFIITPWQGCMLELLKWCFWEQQSNVRDYSCVTSTSCLQVWE